MITDLHAHTYYSHCSADDPHAVADAAVEGGIDALGICDHSYGVIRNGDPAELQSYLRVLTSLKREYEGRLRILCGIELNTHPECVLPDNADLSGFDYALVENMDEETSVLRPVHGRSGIFEYAARLGCKVGIAHTDIFAFAEALQVPPAKFIRALADAGIFWELNVNYDSIHGYREHSYVKRFMGSEYEQHIVRTCGLELSVGFDGHRVSEYKPRRVIEACEFLDQKGLCRAF